MSHRFLWHTAYVLSCYALTSVVPVYSEESNKRREPKSESVSSQAEIRVENQDRQPDSQSEKEEGNVTVDLGVTGNKPGMIEDAIEKLEKQLKSSSLPVELQQKAIESLRAQLVGQTDGRKTITANANWSANQVSDSSENADENPAKTRKTNEKRNDSSNRVQLEFHQAFPNHQPFMMGGGSGMRGPSGMHFTFPRGINSSMVLGPEQKSDLRRAILESLEQDGLSADVIARADKSIEKALDEFGMPRMGNRGNFNTTFRIGVACKPKAPGESQEGLEVEKVFEETSAFKAGIKPGDRLTSIDDKPIHSHEDIVAAVQEAGEAGRAVQIKTYRGDVEIGYALEPSQVSVANLEMGMGTPAFGFQPQAWVMPQMSSGAMNMQFGPPQFSPGPAPVLENQNEKNIDKLQRELSEVRKELDEMKDMLKKLSKQP